MINFIVLAFMLLINSAAYAKEDIPVITRFDATTGSYQSAVIWAKEMSALHPHYDFVVQNVPGAQGENADRLVIQLSRAGKKVVWFGSSISFTTNRTVFNQNSWDRDRDLIPIKGFSLTHQVLFVNRNSSLDSLRNKMKTQQLFFGTTLNGGGGDTLNNLIVSYFNLQSVVKEIKYKNAAEVLNALIKNEIDYTILAQSNIRNSDVRPIIISSRTRSDHELLRDIPTGIEVGLKKFLLASPVFFSVAKENIKFGESLIPYIEKICDNVQIKELKDRTGQETNCGDRQEIMNYINEELDLIRTSTKG